MKALRRTLSVAELLLLVLFAASQPAEAQFGKIGGLLGNKVPPKVQKGLEKADKAKDAMAPISVEQERAIGREVAAKLVGYFHLYNDPGLTQYVNLVGATVAAQATRQDIQYHFAILDTNDINAFSAPGGYVFVTRGALALCDDESELAGILGHEVEHISGKHMISDPAVMKVYKVTSAVGLGPSDLVPGSPFLQKMANGIVSKTLTQGLAPEAEYDADKIGVSYAHSAGYPADGLQRFLVKLNQATDQGANSFWTRTHPPVSDRNARIQQQIASEKWQDADRPKLADRYAMAVAALKPKS